MPKRISTFPRLFPASISLLISLKFAGCIMQVKSRIGFLLLISFLTLSNVLRFDQTALWSEPILILSYVFFVAASTDTFTRSMPEVISLLAIFSSSKVQFVSIWTKDLFFFAYVIILIMSL